MSGEERLLASWSDKPFTGVRKRRYTVEHRLLAEAFPGVGVDIRHEVRCPEYLDHDRWEVAEVWECRPHGIETVQSNDRWWASA